MSNLITSRNIEVQELFLTAKAYGREMVQDILHSMAKTRPNTTKTRPETSTTYRVQRPCSRRGRGSPIHADKQHHPQRGTRAKERNGRHMTDEPDRFPAAPRDTTIPPYFISTSQDQNHLEPLHVFEQAKGCEGENGRIVESGIDEYTTANRRVDHRKGKQTTSGTGHSISRSGGELVWPRRSARCAQLSVLHNSAATTGAGCESC
jgi:hypothetical protein